MNSSYGTVIASCSGSGALSARGKSEGIMSIYEVSFHSTLSHGDIMRWCRNNLKMPSDQDFFMLHFTDDDHYELTIYDDDDVTKFRGNRDFMVKSIALQPVNSVVLTGFLEMGSRDHSSSA